MSQFIGTRRLPQIMDRALSLSINRTLPRVDPEHHHLKPQAGRADHQLHPYSQSKLKDSGLRKKEQARNMATASMLRTVLPVVFFAVLLSG